MTGDKQQFPVTEVVPHADPMILIDEILQAGDDYLEAAVTIKEHSQFFEGPNGVAAWVGVEYMAQAIAAYSGVKSKRNNEPIKIGFLVGVRHYESSLSFFKKGMRLIIHVKLEFESDGVGVFDCTIENGEPLINAQVIVFQPEDLNSYIRKDNG